jgi:hypothetical protein
MYVTFPIICVTVFIFGVAIFISDVASENLYPPVYLPAAKIYGIFQTINFFQKIFRTPTPPAPTPPHRPSAKEHSRQVKAIRHEQRQKVESFSLMKFSIRFSVF